MIRPLLIVGCVLLAALPVHAQSQKWEAYGGYQFTRFKLSYATQEVDGNGWDAALGYKINDWAAAKVDVGGSYTGGATLDNTTYNSGPVNLHTYTFGPVFSVPDQGVKPFVEILIGGYTEHNQLLGSPVQGWALMGGGGADLQVAKRLAWRFEADWLGLMSGFTPFDNQGSKANFRFSTGLVIRF